jgi:hypothetical protein
MQLYITGVGAGVGTGVGVGVATRPRSMLQLVPKPVLMIASLNEPTSRPFDWKTSSDFGPPFQSLHAEKNGVLA